ncbi:Uncharacterized protein SCF082_LOCUS10974 [Durusdinium trenchii]|uniref:Uncharacterized protein n=1 Tax=Durusdinium trenchii TaxID=1381693 RepID=A0ABP0J9X4_9DINO
MQRDELGEAVQDTSSKAWNGDRIQCWADASDEEDILTRPREREARPRRQKRIYSRQLLLQVRDFHSDEIRSTPSSSSLRARRIEDVKWNFQSVTSTEVFKPGRRVHVFDPALAATAFEAVLSWLEPGIACPAEPWRREDEKDLPKDDVRRATEMGALLEGDTEEETSDESPSLMGPPTRCWPWLLLWAWLLFLSYVWHKPPAVQAARPSSFAQTASNAYYGDFGAN